MAEKEALHLTLELQREMRADRWALICDGLGIFAYGETLEEAENWLGGAVAALLNSFHGDNQAMEEWLQRKSINYQFSEDVSVDSAAASANATGESLIAQMTTAGEIAGRELAAAFGGGSAVFRKDTQGLYAPPLVA